MLRGRGRTGAEGFSFFEQDFQDFGHDVHATDPDPAMLALLERNLPEVRVSQAPAEEIPAGDRSYDVVVSAQAFHWFDLERALPEIARVLKPRGRLALVWNERAANRMT